jgi:hypothetical protein
MLERAILHSWEVLKIAAIEKEVTPLQCLKRHIPDVHSILDQGPTKGSSVFPIYPYVIRPWSTVPIDVHQGLLLTGIGL